MKEKKGKDFFTQIENASRHIVTNVQYKYDPSSVLHWLNPVVVHFHCNHACNVGDAFKNGGVLFPPE